MKICGVVGWKNSGKTGLVERLVSEFVRRGYSVSTIKHAHHSFDVDHPGRDSYRHRDAGARQVLLSSRKRWALMAENTDGSPEPELSYLLGKLSPVDLVLVEGFKAATHPKIEAHRISTGQPLVAPRDPQILAVASDDANLKCGRPVFDLDETGQIAEFIADQIGLSAPELAGAKPLERDCFALPEGVDWVPVDAALAQLRAAIGPVVGMDTSLVAQAGGRVLAQDVVAARASPPLANTAVDGYAFAGLAIAARGCAKFELLEGRAAPGAAYQGRVGSGQAVRVLTGAPLPQGTDSVALQEHVTIADGELTVLGPLAPGDNARQAGEDLAVGDTALASGRRLRPQDLALLASVGVDQVSVTRPLRVGVLSTGNELVELTGDAGVAGVYDANRHMLLGLVGQWGHHGVDLGICRDDRRAIEAAVQGASDQVDVLLTSGGASSGDEDHMAAVLSDLGSLSTWRIAIKPGRPLALGQVAGMPVFGLPGNPVAAFVCTLLFARPALSVLAGGAWDAPQGFWVPAGFSKSKKAGRREYLRARMAQDGRVERFKSEGSGRVSGLSWAGGLVELPDEAMQVRPGDLVRYIPYGSFGLV